MAGRGDAVLDTIRAAAANASPYGAAAVSDVGISGVSAAELLDGGAGARVTTSKRMSIVRAEPLSTRFDI